MHLRRLFRHMLFTTRLATHVDDGTHLFGVVVLNPRGEIFIVAHVRVALRSSRNQTRTRLTAYFGYDKLHGGSFRRWCSEGFEDRKEGSDFIVLVSRKPSYVRRNEWAWSVEIAEVNTALPTVSSYSIASKCQDNSGYLRTVLTLKNRNTWFNVPMQEMPDLKTLFRQSFDEAFPGEWNQVANEKSGVDASEEGTTSLADNTSLAVATATTKCCRRDSDLL